MIRASYGKTDGSVESGTSKNIGLHIKFVKNEPRLDIEMPVGTRVVGCFQLLLLSAGAPRSLLRVRGTLAAFAETCVMDSPRSRDVGRDRDPC